MREAQDEYHWGEFGDVDGLVRTRTKALDTFLADYEPGVVEGRYLPCTLPSIPLDDAVVELVLSDHLLFTYPQFFDYEFHIKSIEAMLRVAKREVRLFPLISSASSMKPPYFKEVVQHIRMLGHEAVAYHFQNGAHEMLRISKRKQPRGRIHQCSCLNLLGSYTISLPPLRHRGRNR